MPKILIVDDEKTILELFRYIFEDAGYEVLTAGNGLQALEVLDGYIPDFMVLDVSMPEMSGKEFILELMRRAQRDRRLGQLPFIVMTGENFMDKELNDVFSSAPGFVCFFPKMVPPEKVLEKVSQILGRT